MKILAVEDDLDYRNWLCATLTFEMRQTVYLAHAEDLASALAKTAGGEPDVVLLDLWLPDSGSESPLQTLISYRSRFPHVPVVVLSANERNRMGPTALQFGAADYLIKGKFTADDLLPTLIRAHEGERPKALKWELEQAIRERKMGHEKLMKLYEGIIKGSK